MKYVTAEVHWLALGCQRLFFSTSLSAALTGKNLQAMLEKHAHDYRLEQIEQHRYHANDPIKLRVRRTEPSLQETAAKVVNHTRDSLDGIIWLLRDDVLIGKHERTHHHVHKDAELYVMY